MSRNLLVALLLTAFGFGCSQDSVIVQDKNFMLDGRSTADLSSDWWKWAMSSPDEINPVRDISGIHCDTGQRGNVWFLAGGFGSSKIRRSCEIPDGKHIFFPVINMVYFPREANNGYTCEQAKSNAAVNNETAIDLFAEIDGVTVKEPKSFRVRAEKCFDVFDWIPTADKPYNAYPSASDGYWILLNPLKKGKHTIKFGGRYNNKTTAFGRNLQDIEYEITVK